MLILFLFIYLSFSQSLIPYPYIKYTHNSLKVKADEKLELNKKIKTENNTIKVALDLNLELSVNDASFLLNKMPDSYFLEMFYGNYIIKGKGRLLKIKVDNFILDFEAGHIFISIKNSLIKILVLDKTILNLYKDDEKIIIKPNNYYEINSDKILNKAFKNYETHINEVFDIDTYKKLINQNVEHNFENNKQKGKVVFCLRNLSGINIDNWYINSDKIDLAKKITVNKLIKSCREKFKDINYAGEYSVFDKNCLYINNNFCQNINVSSEVQLINVSSVLLTGYDKTFIKVKDEEYFEINSKWIFLQEGVYIFRLGKKIDKALVYEDKKIILKGSKKINIKDVLSF